MNTMFLKRILVLLLISGVTLSMSACKKGRGGGGGGGPDGGPGGEDGPGDGDGDGDGDAHDGAPEGTNKFLKDTIKFSFSKFYNESDPANLKAPWKK